MAHVVRICLGGTFHPFHVGHEALLQRAARDATALFVGITTGPLATRPDRTVPSWQQRARQVEAFVRDCGFTGTLQVRALEDPAGPAATGEYDAIVVSPQSTAGARSIDERRRAAGLPPLRTIIVPFVLADDGMPVSATRVAAGRIDRAGRRLMPVRVAVGSANPVKTGAVQDEVEPFLAVMAGTGRLARLVVTTHAVPTGVPEQPVGAQVMDGALRRARSVRDGAPDADYWVGIEAGLVQDSLGVWHDVQACVVQDATGHRTHGWGPAFQYPAWVTRRALDGQMVSDILGPVAGDPRIGGTTGAIGYLTDGLMDRRLLTRIAVRMALVPRIRRGLYDVEPEPTPAPPAPTPP